MFGYVYDTPVFFHMTLQSVPPETYMCEMINI